MPDELPASIRGNALVNINGWYHRDTVQQPADRQGQLQCPAQIQVLRADPAPRGGPVLLADTGGGEDACPAGCAAPPTAKLSLMPGFPPRPYSGTNTTVEKMTSKSGKRNG